LGGGDQWGSSATNGRGFMGRRGKHMVRTLLAVVFALLTSHAWAEWQPPETPEPSTILREAERDARAGRYDDALAKHVWYHENALKHDRGQTGVRLSFALSDWLELGERYPPALAKLEAYRQEARKQVLASKAREVFDKFADFAAISEKVDKENEIVELFVELDEKHPKLAPRAYIVADDHLIAAEKFELCGKYLDGDKAIRRQIQMFEHHQEMVKDRRFGADIGEFGEKTFRKEAATTVAILVKRKREEEAKRVAEKARAAWDDAELHAALDKALKGELPERE
jgi:hypothetical protein